MEVEQDQLRLPTPPPILHAPTLRLPPPESMPNFATVEYPAPVSSVDSALGTIGGVERVAVALQNHVDGAPTSRPIELDLDPENRFFHTIPANVASTHNIVCKVIKRRRKKPKRDVDGNIVEEGIYSIEPVGIEHKIARFRAMADFQYYPDIPVDDETFLLAEAMSKLDVKGIRTYRLSPPSEDFRESAFIPPPAFSRHRLPQNFDMRPAFGTTIQTTESGVTRLVHAARSKTRTIRSIMSFEEQVPAGPEEVLLKELGREVPNAIEARLMKLLEERPVWTRPAMMNQLTPAEVKMVHANKSQCWARVGYTFSDGPFRDLIVRFGYDPRQHPEARFFQHITLRNPENVRIRPQPGMRALSQAHFSGTKPNTERASNLSHIFDGKQVYSKIGHFQLCDISDPLCRSLIDSPDGVLDFCSSDINEGWYAYDYFEQIRQVVRRKWQGLLNGIEVATEDCDDLLRWQCSRESRVGQGRRRAAAKATNALTGVAPRKKKGAKKAEGEVPTSEHGEDGEQDEPDGEESGEGGSGSGSGSEGGAGTLSQKGRPWTSKKPIRTAPWEKPKAKRSKAKQPETEAQLLSRLSRSARRSSVRAGMSVTPAASAIEEEQEGEEQ
ncbi:tau 95 subunit of transcription factor TFIIIC [Rhodotorula toruloides]